MKRRLMLTPWWALVRWGQPAGAIIAKTSTRCEVSLRLRGEPMRGSNTGSKQTPVSPQDLPGRALRRPD
jgi:hypothetical protein